MRISDWSSDVCSSDLGGAVLYGIVQKVAEDSSKQVQITHDPCRICGFIKANINILLLRLDPELITTLGNQLNQVQTPGRQGLGLSARTVDASVDQAQGQICGHIESPQQLRLGKDGRGLLLHLCTGRYR